MKTFLLVMLLAACDVYCNMTPTSKKSTQGDLSSTCEKRVSHSYLDTAIDMISKAKFYIPSCDKITKFHLKKATDCADLFEMGNRKNGVYEVWPINKVMEEKSAFVYCDMSTDGGGWTVIQRRGDFNTPKDYFSRNWQNYKEGFGNIKEDFWLGNEKIFALTNQRLYSVRFDLKDVEQNKSYAVYDKFWIDDEQRQYTLHISMYWGKAGDSMAYHNKIRFSTFDQGTNNCARDDKGGWWYNNCHEANLNGYYHKGKFDRGRNKDGVTWKTWKGYQDSLEWTEIKIRPKYFKPVFS